MHPLPRKKRLILTAKESELWRNGTTEFRNRVRMQCMALALVWSGTCNVVDHFGTIVYSIRDGIPREDIATSLRDQHGGKQCSVLNDAGRSGV